MTPSPHIQEKMLPGGDAAGVRPPPGRTPSGAKVRPVPAANPASTVNSGIDREY